MTGTTFDTLERDFEAANQRYGLTRNHGMVLGLLLLAAVMVFDGFHLEGGAIITEPLPPLSMSAEQTRQVENLNVDDKAQILAEGAEAEERNDSIPYSAQPVEHIRSFVLPQATGETYKTALRCLTQAVYYEAGNEPIDGRRAVAQVVLNRVRHPAYPNSICGVVYEGSQRQTGCQFSFTCDGALLRKPSAKSWQEAETVAQQALAGAVEKDVGTATNYHADYVLPRWAFQLAKIDKIGRHIFYRLRGEWGRRAMFASSYSGIERIPSIDYSLLRQRLVASADGQDANSFTPGLTVPPKVTDRHTASDVGGRLDVTKTWRLSIPDPVAASSNYRAAIAKDSSGPAGSGDNLSSPSGDNRAVR